ncbi:MAG: transporter [Bacteroidales bacterium]|nr:transporter [Bacteroidales bacterium]MDT8431488.1 transporter [Bacteroidales bacterium]
MAQVAQPELITDRPDQTESAAIVPRHALQVETGFLVENDANDLFSTRSFTYNTTLLRFGLLNNFELRAGMDYFRASTTLNNTSLSSTISGISPLYTGFKIKIAEAQEWHPQVAFLGGLVLPFTADSDRKPNYTAANIRFAFSHSLSNRFSLGYNLGAEWDGDSPVPGYFYSAALGFAVTDKLGAFFESYGLIPETGNAEHLMDAGLTYLLLPTLQLDISGGIGLNQAAIRNFISLGLSFRIPGRKLEGQQYEQ